MNYEIRTAEMWPDVDYEMRAAADGFTFEGYAAVFNQPSRPLAFPSIRAGQPFREVIHGGAFTKTLSEQPDVTLRWEHQMTALPLGRTKAGTLELTEDDHGLRVRASLPDNEWGRPVRDAIARGDISGMSFRFRKVIDKWTKDAESPVRHLHEVALGPEVSVSAMPAYMGTIANVRALAEEADVDPDALISALTSLKPEARLSTEEAEALVAVVHAHSDLQVVRLADVQKLAAMRDRLGPPPAA